jgi:hypothetical protein
MALPATKLPFPVLDFGCLLDQLPAEVRAQLAWARKPIDDGLARLRTEALTDALVDEVALALRKPIIAAAVEAEQWLAGLTEQVDMFESEIEADRARVRALLPDDDSKDTLDWIMDFLQALMAAIVDATEDQPVPHALDVEEVEQEHDPPAFRAYLRGSVALMATIEIAKLPSASATAVERAAELLDVAFLELMEFSDRAADLLEAPFDPPSTAPVHRGERLAFYAKAVRDTLTDADWEVIESARLGNLR